jgi:hypothetical protein
VPGATLQFTWKGQIRLYELLDSMDEGEDFRHLSDLDQFLLLWDRSDEGSDLEDDPRILEHFGGLKGLETVIRKAQTEGYLTVSVWKSPEELREVHIRDQDHARALDAFGQFSSQQEARQEMAKRRRALRRAQRINERLTKDEDQDPSL